MWRYKSCVCAGIVAFIFVLGGWGWGSQANAASPPNEYGNVCEGKVLQGSGVTKIAPKHAEKKGEDTWSEYPQFVSSATRTGWTLPPALYWGTIGGFYRGCSNAITFAAAGQSPDQAIIGVRLANPFGASGDVVADCRVLHAQGVGTFTCQRISLSNQYGRLTVAFKLTHTGP
jgi:hypothetical protein